MVMDIISDRYDFHEYDPQELYEVCLNDIDKSNHFQIAKAMESKDNRNVQKALCDYITIEGYYPEICDYIMNENWI